MSVFSPVSLNLISNYCSICNMRIGPYRLVCFSLMGITADAVIKMATASGTHLTRCKTDIQSVCT